MKEKYLPIGTICQIKGNINLIMIKGYYGRTYNNIIKNYDYIGCKYPEGDLLENYNVFFNHTDIVSIVFNGYESVEFKKLNGILFSLEGDNSKIVKPQIDDDMVYKFDENGVVVFDGKSSQITSDEGRNSLDSNKEILNPFVKNYDEIKINKPNSSQDIFKKYTFDENGVVIGEEVIQKENQKSD